VLELGILLKLQNGYCKFYSPKTYVTFKACYLSLFEYALWNNMTIYAFDDFTCIEKCVKCLVDNLIWKKFYDFLMRRCVLLI